VSDLVDSFILVDSFDLAGLLVDRVSDLVESFVFVNSFDLTPTPVQNCDFGGGDSRHFGPMCLLFLN